jgi:hypothetical protein
MEMSQEKQCTATLNKKNHYFFFTKPENGRAEQVLSWGWYQLGGRMWGKGVQG